MGQQNKPRGTDAAYFLGARGWEYPAWDGRFYPDDLPSDWRLIYYANEFSTVLVPEDRFAAASNEELEEWAEEVPEGFRFFVEIRQKALEEGDVETLAARLQLLGEHLGGVVIPGPSAHRCENADTIRELAPVFGQWGSGSELLRLLRPLGSSPQSVGQSVSILGEDAACHSVRQLRGWVEDVGEVCSAKDLFLFLDGPTPDIQLLQDGKTMLELMGLA